MKISKRLLAVLMAVVMILTIVPLGLFAFADDEEPERETKTWHIKTLEDFNNIGNEEEDMLLSDNYILDNDIIPQTVTDKVLAWLASDEANQTAAGEALAPLYGISNNESAVSGTDYYEKGAGDEYTKVEFTEGKQYEPDVYYVLEYVKSNDAFDENAVYYVLDGQGKYNEIDLTSDTYEVDTYYVKQYTLSNGEFNDNVVYYEEDSGTYSVVEFIPAKLYEKDKYYTLVLAEGDKLTPSLLGDMPSDAFAVAYPKVQELSEVKDTDADPNAINMVSGNFTGTFDGQGYTIDQVVLKQTTGVYCGLFENNKGTIKNLTLGDKFYIEFSPDISKLSVGQILMNFGVATGGIAGINANKATISNCKFKGSLEIHFDSYFTKEYLDAAEKSILGTFFALPIDAGGIAGMNTGTIEDNCTSNAACVSTNYVGGTGIRLGQIVGTDNDIVASSVNIKVTDFETKPDNAEVLRTEQVDGVDRYQLLKVTDESGTYYYIRTIACDHASITDENHTAAVAPTCKSAGNIEYWTCPDCKQKFAGSEKPTINSTSVLAIGLSKDSTNHDAAIKHTAAVEPTCVDGNKEYWYCETCDKYMIKCTDPEEENFVTIEGVDGKFIEVEQSKIIVEATDNHTLGDPVVAKDATCLADGIAYNYYQCSDCNKYFKDADGTQEVQENDWVVKALGHAWDEGKVTQDPTYDATGVKTYTCTREGCGETKTEDIPKLVPPTVTPKSSSGYKATKTGSLNTIILPNPSNKSGTTVTSFKSNLESGYTYVVKDSKGKTVTSGPIGTNYTVEISGYPSTKVTVIVRGDTDCNGEISAMDYIKIKNHMRGTNKITDAILKIAADANNDNGISANDYVRIKNIMRNKSSK